jgi:hypothetical protein
MRSKRGLPDLGWSVLGWEFRGSWLEGRGSGVYNQTGPSLIQTDEANPTDCWAAQIKLEGL